MDDQQLRALAATRPGYATYPDSRPGSPSWWTRHGQQPPQRPEPHPITFEDALADPHSQYDPADELLPHLLTFGLPKIDPEQVEQIITAITESAATGENGPAAQRLRHHHLPATPPPLVAPHHPEGTVTVLHKPAPRHSCRPGWEWHPHPGGGLLGDRLRGRLVGNPPDPWRFPRGTVWVCDCGRTWVSCGSPAPHMPGACAWRREGWFERWRRERRQRPGLPAAAGGTASSSGRGDFRP